MKVESIINIKLDSDEVKQAIKNWMDRRESFVNDGLSKHMENNFWSWDIDGDGNFVICVDGVYKEEEV